MNLEITNDGQTIIGTVKHISVIGYEQNGGWYEIWRTGDEDRPDGVSLGLVHVVSTDALPAAETKIAAWLVN